MKQYITKTIVLEEQDLATVQKYAKRKGLDNQRGFSAAVRGILRKFEELTAPPSPDNGNENPGDAHS